MTFSYIFLLPAALTNLWALYVKFRQRKIPDLVILLLCTLAVALTFVPQQSGFADAGYMTKKFKAKHGVTPTEWHKTH